MIKKLPIEYVEAVDGVDALERFKEFQPDASESSPWELFKHQLKMMQLGQMYRMTISFALWQYVDHMLDRMPRMNGCEFASAAREVEKARGWQASRSQSLVLYLRPFVDTEFSRRNNRTGLFRLANEGDGAAQWTREPMAGQSSLTSLVYSTNT